MATGGGGGGGGYKAPTFHHIHCSSRYDRSVESLESDLDTWMSKSSLITLTEVASEKRARALREKGWGYYNATAEGGRADDAAICWRRDTWLEKQHWLRKLHGPFHSTHQVLSGNWSTTVLLRHTESGDTLLVSVSHMPHGVEAQAGFKTTGEYWEDRKKTYQESIKAWSTHIKDLTNKYKPDGALVIADWNVSLKLNWFRDYLADHWKGYHQAWVRFPTEGGSLTGGPVAPLGAPGKGNHDRIIDGTLYQGLKVTDEPNLMARVRSSDHRPYQESFRFLGKTEDPTPDQTDTTGNVHYGEVWWGFGDYMDDEIYAIEQATES